MTAKSSVIDRAASNGASADGEPRELAHAVARVMAKSKHLFLAGISWTDYQTILNELEGERRLRHAYDQGRLELMVRSWEHERPKMLWAYLIFVLAEELDLSFEAGGELTLQREDLDRGLEPDQCFWFQNAEHVRGKKKLDFQVDPPPDLFLEIEVSRTILDRIDLLAALGVPEVWRINDSQCQVGILQESGQYDWATTSRAIAGLDAQAVAEFVKNEGAADRMKLLRSFRAWVRDRRQEGKL